MSLTGTGRAQRGVAMTTGAQDRFLVDQIGTITLVMFDQNIVKSIATVAFGTINFIRNRRHGPGLD